jgi:hypothetical protein
MILVGTVHNDLQGPERLERVLDRYQPKRISVECPKGMTVSAVENELRNYNRVCMQHVKKAGFPENFERFLNDVVNVMGYERLVAIQYAKRKGYDILFTDHADASSVSDCWEESFIAAMGRLSQLVKEDERSYEQTRADHCEIIDRAYYEPKILMSVAGIDPELDQAIDNMFDPATDVLTDERERVLAGNIIDVQPNLHIGGMMHIFEMPEILALFDIKEPLYKLLEGQYSKRIRLCEALAE